MSETPDRGAAVAADAAGLRVTTRTVEFDRITSRCSVCGGIITAANKGLGRATVAAWESRHGGNCDE